MVDTFHINDLSRYVNVFYSNGDNNSWQTWTKPKNINFIDILAIGAGGGGGAGYVSNGGAGGGAGGGSGAITKGFFPANLLPDTLYIQVGQGGSGGTGRGQNGSSGTSTSILVDVPITTLTIQHYLILANGGSGGEGGKSTVLSDGGIAGVVWTPNSIASSLGIVDAFAGTAGGNGVASSSGVITNVIPTSIVSGGAGGGSVGTSASNTINGNSIIASGFNITISGGTVGNVTNRDLINGNHGFTNLPSANTSLRLPMFFTGGAGGGPCNANANGGIGGNGSFGSGGGGGGGSFSLTITQVGVGGRGGDGLVIITCY